MLHPNETARDPLDGTVGVRGGDCALANRGDRRPCPYSKTENFGPLLISRLELTISGTSCKDVFCKCGKQP